MRPEDTEEIDDDEIVGTIGFDEDNEPFIETEEGERVPFTGEAASQLTIADPDVDRLAGQTTVVRVAQVPTGGSASILNRDGTESPVPGHEDLLEPTSLSVVEVRFQDEA